MGKKTPRPSAGLLLFREDTGGALSVLLVHPGGPFFAGKDEGVWSIPKGEIEPGEEGDLLAVARRELREETGLAPEGPFVPLESVRQKSGKVVTAWACRAEADPAAIRSNTFSMEWPPRSGRMQEFPEIDRASWFAPADARRKIISAQAAFIDRLEASLARSTR